MFRPINVMNDPLSTSEKLFAIYKGDSGAGKTIAAASNPKPIIFDFDRRTAPIRTFYPDRTDIEIIRFNSHLQVLDALNELELSCPYETIIIDSLTWAAASVMQGITALKGGKGMIIGGISVNEIGDYNAESSFLMQMIDKLKSFQGRKHVIVTAHVIQTETKELKTNRSIITRTLLTAGKRIAKIIPCAFDETYHFQVESSLSEGQPDQRIVYTQSTGDDWAKTALNIPAKLNFTDRSFYEVWMEAQGREVEPKLQAVK